MPGDRPVIATYRLQLHAGFTFAHAMERVPYLKALGVSHLYLSPVLQAAKGSTHGYDLIDPTRINDELGGREGFEQLAKSAHAHGLGLILDIVPNHMSISDPQNRWWWDVLQYGPKSSHAHAFDIDWDAPDPHLKDRVLIPVLGDHRYRVLERREVQVERKGGTFMFRYREQRFPLAPKSVGPLLREAAQLCTNHRVAFFGDAYEQLAHHGVISDLLEELLDKSPMCSAALDQVLIRLNDDPERLDALLDQQAYRLAFWRTAERDLDYRRFFDVSSLVGLRADDPRVFEASHGLLRELLEQGLADGLRVDHIDGLANPRGYLERLAELAKGAPLWVEKVLAAHEPLEAWPVQGTTGYDFLNDLTALFVPAKSEVPLSALVHELAGQPADPSFEDLAVDAKEQVLEELLASDVNRLTQDLIELRERHRDMRDFSRHELRALVRALAAGFPVYRTYLEPGHAPSPGTLASIRTAVSAARARHPELDGALFEFARDLLLGTRPGAVERRFVERLQQLTAPAAAKGVEDTALYRDVRLLALDEVGGSPARFSLPLAEFHARQLEGQAKWPGRMLTLSTHDTKRSADARARLVALSHDVTGYGALARDFFGAVRTPVDGSMKLLALQTLVSAWPVDLERLRRVLLKSAREAKLHTRWTRPVEVYEERIDQLAREVLENDPIRELLTKYVSSLEAQARGISLAWALLTCTCPGVPDLYQGHELWAHQLVDPDNRGAVDWRRRDAALEVSELPGLAHDGLGVNKLHVIRRALTLRTRRPELFGEYAPLGVTGVERDAVVAFSRGGVVVVAALRRVEDWATTAVALPEGTFESALFMGPRHQGRARLASLFEQLPVALLKLNS